MARWRIERRLKLLEASLAAQDVPSTIGHAVQAGEDLDGRWEEKELPPQLRF